MLETKDILQQEPLFQKFSELELDELAKLFIQEEYKESEFIIQENCSSSDLYFIHSGTAEVIKNTKNKEYKLFELQAKEFFGELTFIDEQQRSSSIKAKTNTVVLRLKKEDLAKIPPKYSYLTDKLTAQLSKIIIERLRTTNQKNLAEMEHRNRLGQFSIILMMALSLITCLTGFIKNIREYIPIYFVAPAIMSVCIFLMIKLLRVLQMPLENFGFTFKNSKKSFIEGMAISIVLIIVFFALTAKEDLVYMQSILFSKYRGLIYFVVALVQELIYRGVLQTALQETYHDSKGYLSVALTSLIFGISHVYLGFFITVSSLGAGVLLGFVYMRHRNLIGVTIIHFVLGCMAVALRFIGT